MKTEQNQIATKSETWFSPQVIGVALAVCVLIGFGLGMGFGIGGSEVAAQVQERANADSAVLQEEVIIDSLLKAKCRVGYEHEFDDQGRRLLDPPKLELGARPVLVELEAPKKIDLAVVSQLTTLRRLRLKTLEGRNHIRNVEDLSKLTNLEVLEAPIVIDLKAVGQVENLKRLRLNTNYIISSEIVENLQGLGNLKKLESLEINVPGLNLKDISAIHGCTALTELLLTASQIQNVEVIRELKNLKTLKVGVYAQHQIEAVSELSQLRKLELEDFAWDRLNNWKIVEQKYESLAKLKNLEELSFPGHERADSLLFLEQLPRLKKLTLRKMPAKTIGWARRLKLEDLAKVHAWTLPLPRDVSEIDAWRIKPFEGQSSDPRIDISHGNSLDFQRVRQVPSLHTLDAARTIVPPAGKWPVMSALKYFNLNDSSIEDLAPVEPLKTLLTINIRNTRVANLSPVKNGPSNLQYLDISSTRVTDLSPLESISQLYDLNISSTGVADLSPLKNLSKLSDLNISSTDVSDLSPLENCQALIKLDLSGSKVANVKSLEKLRNLREIFASQTKIEDWSAIARMPDLYRLKVNDTPISSLRPVKNLPRMAIVVCNNSPISDLSPLQDHPSLLTLLASNTNVRDASPLSGCLRLKSFDLSGTQLQRLPDLSRLRKLTSLNVADTAVSDLTPLKKFEHYNPMDRGSYHGLYANFAGTKVTDISALAGVQFDFLDLSRTAIIDFSPLRNVPARSVKLTNTGFDSLQNAPYATVIADGTKVKNLAGLSPMVQVLNLSRSDITDLSKTTFSLRRLNLSQTRVSDLSPLTDAKKLIALDISQSDVGDLSPLIGMNFKSLNVSKTEVSELPATFTVEELNLADTPVSKLDKLDLQELTLIDLSRTKVTDISPLANAKKLATLRLSGTKPEMEGFRQFSRFQLDHLDLSDCEISSIDALSRLEGLLTLKINCAGITDLSAITKMNVLEELTLENVAADLDLKPVGKLKYLDKLTISGELKQASRIPKMLRVNSISIPENSAWTRDLFNEHKMLRELQLGDKKILFREP